MLELKNVSFEVSDEKAQKEIIRGINLKIDDNKFVVITGPNGGGKSTLAKLIVGIEKPTSGQILVLYPSVFLGFPVNAKSSEKTFVLSLLIFFNFHTLFMHVACYFFCSIIISMHERKQHILVQWSSRNNDRCQKIDQKCAGDIQ